jgi:hypothetical protein
VDKGTGLLSLLIVEMFVGEGEGESEEAEDKGDLFKEEKELICCLCRFKSMGRMKRKRMKAERTNEEASIV